MDPPHSYAGLPFASLTIGFETVASQVKSSHHTTPSELYAMSFGWFQKNAGKLQKQLNVEKRLGFKVEKFHRFGELTGGASSNAVSAFLGTGLGLMTIN